jgi:hypothetical protein
MVRKGAKMPSTCQSYTTRTRLNNGMNNIRIYMPIISETRNKIFLISRLKAGSEGNCVVMEVMRFQAYIVAATDTAPTRGLQFPDWEAKVKNLKCTIIDSKLLGTRNSSTGATFPGGGAKALPWPSRLPWCRSCDKMERTYTFTNLHIYNSSTARDRRSMSVEQ